MMREAIRNKRNAIKDEQEKLSNSMTTPLCRSEEAILQDSKWMKESKDLNGSFDKIPPIQNGNKVAGNGAQSYYVDIN